MDKIQKRQRELNIYNLSNMNEIVNTMITHMAQQIENLALSDSKFVFDEVVRMDVDFHQLNRTRGSSYLPEWLARKKVIINPHSKDLECCKWAVIAATRWEEINSHPEQITKLKRFETDFSWTGVGFSVSFRTIKRFESQNQILINMLAVEDREIHICRKGGDYDQIANLMLIPENNRKHYVAIKSLSRLLSKQNSKHKEAQHFCTNCLQGFREERSRDEHVSYCKNNEVV